MAAEGTAPPEGSAARPVTVPSGVCAGAPRQNRIRVRAVEAARIEESTILSQYGYRRFVVTVTPALAAAIFFAWLAVAVRQGTVAGFDLAVRNTVHSWTGPTLTRAMRGITELGSWPFLCALAVAASWALARRGRVRAAYILVLSAIGAELFDQLLKAIFRRPRPEAFFGMSPGNF